MYDTHELCASCVCGVQGVDASHGGLQLVSHVIWKMLDIDVSVLMGANIANEVAKEMFCEATIGRLCVWYCVCVTVCGMCITVCVRVCDVVLCIV